MKVIWYLFTFPFYMIYYFFKWFFILSYRLMVLIYELIFNNRERKNNLTRDFDNLDGHEFETFCRDLLSSNGFKKVEVTRGSGDQGIDVLAYNGNKKVGFQCKNYSSKVSNTAVQEAYAGQSFYGLDEVYVLTNNYFTDSAKQLALSTGVILLDRNYILNSTKTIYKKQKYSINKFLEEKNNKNTSDINENTIQLIELYHSAFIEFLDELYNEHHENNVDFPLLNIERDTIDESISQYEKLLESNNISQHSKFLYASSLSILCGVALLNSALAAQDFGKIIDSSNELSDDFYNFFDILPDLKLNLK